MKRWKGFILLSLLIVMSVGCGNKEKDSEEKAAEETQKDTLYNLITEDGEVEINLQFSEEYQETEYSTESWLSLEIPEDEESSVQLMLHLDQNTIQDVENNLRKEIDYLLSANTENKADIEIESSTGECGEWFWFTYGYEELEGYKIWVELKNDVVLTATLEMIGENAREVAVEELIVAMDETLTIE